MSGVSRATGVLTCAALAAALLGGCSGGAEDETPPPAPQTVRSPSSSAAPSAAATPLRVTRYYETHPGTAPTVVEQSQVVLDERLTGTRTVEGLDLGGFTDVVLYLTCTGEVAYQIVLGTAEEPDANVSGSTSCGGGISASFVVPVPPGAPFTQVTARMPEGAAYYLTVYGKPPVAS